MKNPFALPRRIALSGPLRWLVPVLLALLIIALLVGLPWQARQLEANERQEQLIADTLWVEQTIRFELARNEDLLRALAEDIGHDSLHGDVLHQRLVRLVGAGRSIQRLVVWDKDGAILSDSGTGRVELSPASQAAMDRARRTRQAQYADPPPGRPRAALDLHLPIYHGDVYLGSLMASYDVYTLLNDMVPWWFAQDNQISVLDGDERLVARRAAAGEGKGVYTHKHALDLRGTTLVLATDSIKGAPRLLPNLLVGSVILLALGLVASLAALWRHIARRLAAEGALKAQMAFRHAMENSTLTGLRARDLEGRVTYVNRAFCQIVGLPAEELIGKAPPMPYWAPEAMADYQGRVAEVLAGSVTPQFETVFLRPNGERVPVLIFEAPLVDAHGRQTGWVGSILDISARKRAEELARQQQEKLQVSNRLATMGEISSMLAHELNQPLAAISSYTTGALNLVQRGAVDPEMLRQALEQASAQAQRAGQIIRSVHEFVKKREPERQPVSIEALLEAVRTLIDLQARKYFVTVQTEIAPGLPPVNVDRMMIEQVLLNLTRNAIEAMQDVGSERRVLVIGARCAGARVAVWVADQGHGIAPDVAERLYSPFFSTKAEGMGMGLSICRTAVEFHGGTLVHSPNPQGGTIFTFDLPAL
ncbi:sensor histidine kinase [Massilia sp. TS11]|uniref:sensor histidine kinase n=1 Tax=Massilia sp. TS11 TaxID=2908003 RepID=UPI001EDA5780|nr:PAS domain S-box protein [Massilia sp. TS11]MCG2583535.1 PAS domain S-box protein [Massilia sp. TS11]